MIGRKMTIFLFLKKKYHSGAPGGGGVLGKYTGGGVPWHTKKGVLGAGTTRKRGVLGAGQVKKGSLPRHIHILDIYVCPPPPGLRCS